MSVSPSMCNARLVVPDQALSTAYMKLNRAAWANRYFQNYDHKKLLHIADAVARAGFEKAGHFADLAVRETGFGVAEHKTIKNQLCTHELLNYYREMDLATPRIDEQRKVIEIPKPAGVILALAPATNPVATIYYKAMLAILSRNSVVFCPHPAARGVSSDAARHLAAAAEAAGAPAGAIQCIDDSSVSLAQNIMASEKINVIMATGGGAMVRAAYSSGNPALGVGPGNAVAYIDPSARVDHAAKCLVDSKSFDNSILCTNESVVLTLDANRGNVERALRSAGAHLCSEQDTNTLRDYLFNDNVINSEAIGKSASWIADRAGIRVSPSAKILVPVVATPGQDDNLFKEKLCPVLTLTTAVDFTQAMTFAKHTCRGGAGHSAAFHGEDNARLVAFSKAVPVNRVVVNAPCSQGASGFATHLAPSFMIGTGYAGRSSVGENVGPQHLVNWTRVAFARDASVRLEEIDLNEPTGTGASMPSPMPTQTSPATTSSAAAAAEPPERDELRRLILEELRNITREQHD